MTASPSRLEYAYAFDLAASWLERAGGPYLAVVSTPEFVDLIASRVTGNVIFACDDERTLDHAARRVAASTYSDDEGETGRVWPAVETVAQPETFGSVFWAAPQHGSWEVKLAAIGRLVAPAGEVCLFTGTSVSAFLRPLRARQEAGGPAPLAGRVHAGLAASGWQVIRSRRLGGIASAGWAVTGRLAALAGRPDLADRAERAHHIAVESERGASYALLCAVLGGIQ